MDDDEPVIDIEWSKRRHAIRKLVREFVGGTASGSEAETVTKQTVVAVHSELQQTRDRADDGCRLN